MAEHGAWLVPTLVTYDSLHRYGTEYGLPAVSAASSAPRSKSSRCTRIIICRPPTKRALAGDGAPPYAGAP